ncbi:hypothetical protein Tco_0009352 [Tanacetum coccineum]
MVDQLAPPGLFSQLHDMDYDQLFVEFNIGAARQTCLSSEVRLRSEHNYMERKKFERRCVRQTDLLKDRDIKIASLKAQLSLKEAEATEAIRLCDQVSVIKAAEATRVCDLNSLRERNSVLGEEKSVLDGKVAALEFATIAKKTKIASLTTQTAKLTQVLSSLQLSFDELSIKATYLESPKDSLTNQVFVLETTCFGLRDQVSDYELFKEHYEAVQDEQARILSDRVTELDSEIMGMAIHLDEEFYPRFLTTIAGRRWILSRGIRLAVMKCLQSPEYVAALGEAIGRAIDKGTQTGLVAGIDHRNVGRGLADVTAYDPSAKAKYVLAVLAFRNLDFNFLSLLESQKDASIADIMDSLHLKGPFVETLKICQLQPSHEQLLLPIHRKEDNAVIGETSFFEILDVVYARVQKVKEGSSSHRFFISDDMGPLVDPATVTVTTALSTTFAHTSSVPPISVADYGVLGTEPQPEASHSPRIIFEQETLETSPGHPVTS